MCLFKVLTLIVSSLAVTTAAIFTPPRTAAGFATLGNTATSTPSLDSMVKTNSDLKFVYRIYEECSAKEMWPCFKQKLITAIDRLERKSHIPLTSSVSFVKESHDEGKSSSDEQTMYEGRSSEKNAGLDEIIVEKFNNFVEGRSINVKMATLRDSLANFMNSGNVEESRAGKKNKINPLLMFPLLWGSSLVPMFLGLLSLLAGKALMLAKLALTLSLLVGLKKLMGNSEDTTTYVYNHGGGSAFGSWGGASLGPYRRSLQIAATPADDPAPLSAPSTSMAAAATHNEAYRAYIPLSSPPQSSTYQYYQH